MIKTIITLLLVGGLGLFATLSKMGTPRSGREYIKKMKKKYGSRRGRAFYGGGPRYGK